MAARKSHHVRIWLSPPASYLRWDIYGEWLSAIGFPIGAAAYLVSDQQGELALSRIGLKLPRRLKIRAAPV